MNHVSGYSPTIPDRRILWLILGVILIKLLLLPFAQTIDADAVSRTFISMDWLQHPIWITNGVWGPFHFYFTAFILALWHNTIYAPVVLNIILSAITLLPFYFFVKREFNSNGAFVASCFLAISPIIFRYSLMNMSEPPYLLFLTITLNLLSRGFKNKNTSDFFLAGLSITIACGFRFEAWIFILLFTFVILLKKEKTNALLFFAAAILYPASDIITHFVQDHYSLRGFYTNYPWNLHPTGYFAPHTLEDTLRALWFIPFCWFISLGPMISIILKEIILTRRKNKGLLWCVILFWAFFILTEVSAFRGSIILHTRFSATITLLSIPFMAGYFKELSPAKVRLAALFGMLTIGLTFVYNIQNITPLPRLTDQNGAKAAKIIAKEITPESGLIIDFWEWENSGYVGLQSKLALHNMYISGGDDKDPNMPEEINAVLKDHPQGVILLVKNSLLWQNTIFSDNHLKFKFNTMALNTKEIFHNETVTAWKYISADR